MSLLIDEWYDSFLEMNFFLRYTPCMLPFPDDLSFSHIKNFHIPDYICDRADWRMPLESNLRGQPKPAVIYSITFKDLSPTIPPTPICICICMCICIYICICICICNSFAKEKFVNAISNFHSFETLPLFQFPFESFDFYPLKDLVFNWKLNVKTLSWPATPYFNLLWIRLEIKGSATQFESFD